MGAYRNIASSARTKRNPGPVSIPLYLRGEVSDGKAVGDVVGHPVKKLEIMAIS